MLSVWRSYVFCLPLIADGRIAWTHLVKHSARAMVERRSFDGAVQQGHVTLQENEWTCTWDDAQQSAGPNVRIVGGRFSMGDRIGLKPVGQALELFLVNEVAAVLAGPPWL